MPTATPGVKAAWIRGERKKDQIEIQTSAQAGALRSQTTLLDQRDVKERALKADEAMGEMGQVDAILGRIDSLIPKVNTPGLGGRLAGLTSRPVQEFFQTDANINEMSALSKSYVTVIAKVVQRQSGVLSNQDLSRAEMAVSQIGDNTEVATRKSKMLKFLRDKARSNAERLRSGKEPLDIQPPPELEGGSSAATPVGSGSAPAGFRAR